MSEIDERLAEIRGRDWAAFTGDEWEQYASVDLRYLLDLVQQLQRQRDEARAEFDSLGPQIEALEKAKAHIRADNKNLFNNWREEQTLVKKWMQRAETADAEAVDLRQQLADAERAAEVRLARIEVLRGALEAVGTDAQALKPEVQQVQHDD